MIKQPNASKFHSPQCDKILHLSRSFYPSFACYSCLEYSALGEIASQRRSPRSARQKESFSLLQVQSGREIAGDGEAEGNILKKVFEAAGSSSVLDRFGRVLT